MNAAMLKCDTVEGVSMAESENDRLGIQVAKLRSDVEHIQADVTDIKADLRATRVRFDNLDQKVDSLREKMEQRFESTRKDIDARFDKAAQEVNARFDKVEARFNKVDERFDNMDARLESFRDRFDSMTKQIGDMKVWAVLLYVALAGTLLGVMAHGFKWI